MAGSAAPPMAAQVARGSIWLMINTAAGRLASLGAQIVLAWFLTKSDFGVFATASSAAIFATFLRDGGVRDLLIQRQGAFRELLGPMFWLAGAMNFVSGLLVTAIGAGLALATSNPVYFWMLLLIGIAVPLNTLPSILSVKLSIELRFADLARVQIAAAAVRFGGSIALAMAGFGPLSFVAPLPLVAVVELLLFRKFVKERPWREPARTDQWWPLLGQSKWILIGTLGAALVNMGNYSVVRLFVKEDVVGVYFFAHQIVAQVGILVAANMNQVLFAAFAKINDDDRLRRGVARALRQLMFLAVPTSLALIPVFPGLEEWMWGERWRGAVRTVLIIAAVYPMTVINAVPYAALQAAGRFRAWAILLIVLGVAILLAGMAGAAIGRTPEWIGFASCTTFAIGCVLMAWLALRPLRLGLADILKNTVPVYAVGLVAALLAWYVEGLLAQQSSMQHGVGALARAVIGGGVFAAGFGLLALVLLRSHVRETVQVLPARLRSITERLPLIRGLAA